MVKELTEQMEKYPCFELDLDTDNADDLDKCVGNQKMPNLKNHIIICSRKNIVTKVGKISSKSPWTSACAGNKYDESFFAITENEFILAKVSPKTTKYRNKELFVMKQHFDREKKCWVDLKDSLAVPRHSIPLGIKIQFNLNEFKLTTMTKRKKNIHVLSGGGGVILFCKNSQYIEGSHYIEDEDSIRGGGLDRSANNEETLKIWNPTKSAASKSASKSAPHTSTPKHSKDSQSKLIPPVSELIQDSVDEQPDSVVQKPVSVDEQPDPTVQQPVSVDEQPDSTVQQPVSVDQQPDPTVHHQVYDLQPSEPQGSQSQRSQSEASQSQRSQSEASQKYHAAMVTWLQQEYIPINFIFDGEKNVAQDGPKLKYNSTYNRRELIKATFDAEMDKKFLTNTKKGAFRKQLMKNPEKYELIKLSDAQEAINKRNYQLTNDDQYDYRFLEIIQVEPDKANEIFNPISGN